MPNYNTGTPIRFPNGATLSLGAAVGSIQVVDNLVDGSIEYTAPGYEQIAYKQGGQLRNVVYGDERESMLKFELYRTPTLHTLLAIMRPAATNGEQTFFYGRVQVPDYLNATAGRRFDFTKLYMPDDCLHRAASAGPEFDKIVFELRNFRNSLTEAAY